MNLCIEYSSDIITILSDSVSEYFYFILLENSRYYRNVEKGYFPQLKIDTFNDGLTNNDVENVIKELLKDSEHDIDYEIENYRESQLYNLLKCNDENEV